MVMRRFPIRVATYAARKITECKICSSQISEKPRRRKSVMVVWLDISLFNALCKACEGKTRVLVRIKVTSITGMHLVSETTHEQTVNKVYVKGLYVF